MNRKYVRLILSGIPGGVVGALSAVTYYDWSTALPPQIPVLTAIIAVLYGLSIGWSFAYMNYYELYDGGDSEE